MSPRKGWVPRVPADQEDRVAKVEERETVRHGPATEIAGPKCDLNDGRWYCATHEEAFANQLQKDIHIQQYKHRLAWVCFTHGVGPVTSYSLLMSDCSLMAGGIVLGGCLLVGGVLSMTRATNTRRSLLIARAVAVAGLTIVLIAVLTASASCY